MRRKWKLDRLSIQVSLILLFYHWASMERTDGALG